MRQYGRPKVLDRNMIQRHMENLGCVRFEQQSQGTRGRAGVCTGFYFPGINQVILFVTTVSIIENNCERGVLIRNFDYETLMPGTGELKQEQ